MDYSKIISSPKVYKNRNDFYNSILKIIKTLFDQFYRKHKSEFENIYYFEILLNEFINTNDFKGSYWNQELKFILEELAKNLCNPNIVSKLINNFLVKSCSKEGEYNLYTINRNDYLYSYSSNIYKIKNNKIVISKSSDLMNFENKNNNLSSSFPAYIFVKNTAKEIMDSSNLSKLESIEPNHNISFHLIIDKLIELSYFDWVSKSVNQILITPKINGSYYTGSWENIYGLIYLDHTSDKYLFLESLIHEASHQHFYMGEMLYSYSYDLEKLYYSSAVKSNRPLRAILLAYHAFANVVIYYHSIKELSDSIKMNYLKRSLDIVNQLNSHLNNNSGLSEQGKVIYNLLSKDIKLINKYYKI